MILKREKTEVILILLLYTSCSRGRPHAKRGVTYETIDDRIAYPFNRSILGAGLYETLT